MFVLSGDQITQWIGSWLWAFFRVAAIFSVMPIFSARFVPARYRVALSVLITLVLLPVIPQINSSELLADAPLLTLAREILVGLYMGFILQLVFSAVVFGGQGVALSMGLGFASMIDPQNGVQVPVVGQFLLTLATLVFLLLDGHLALLAALADSFHTLPIGSGGISMDVLWEMLQWTGHIFAAGIMIALPAIAALLVVNIAFGVVTRTAPQLNIFAVGFPAAIMLGFLVLWASLPNFSPLFSSMLDSGFDLMATGLGKD